SAARMFPPNLSNGIQKIPAPAILVEARTAKADLAGASLECGAERPMVPLGRFSSQNQPRTFARPPAGNLEDGQDRFRSGAFDFMRHAAPQAVAVLNVLGLEHDGDPFLARHIQ